MFPVFLGFLEMNFTPRKLFVIVGDPHSGKTRTIQQLFQRKQFYAYKQPIKLDPLWKEKFIVINAPPPYGAADDHLLRIKSVIQHHTAADTSFVLNISLVFDNSLQDIREIVRYFNQTAFEIYYMVLSSSWFDKKVICSETVLQLETCVKNGSIHIFELLVTRSELRFSQRIGEIRLFLQHILAGVSVTKA